ncbi:MAG: TerC family protein [Planctomycetaceae bacterium]|nr:TerC family protein [Planctomycetaceae bacterium]
MDIVFALVALTAMEIVLGIDNIVFIAILAGRLPPAQQPRARSIGLSVALLTRIGLLFSISWVLGLTSPLFHLSDFLPAGWFNPKVLEAAAQAGAHGEASAGIEHGIAVNGISVRDLILLAGGLFLIGKSVIEIHHKIEGQVEQRTAKAASFGGVIFQIALLDMVFSLDSVITAVGMVSRDKIWVMVVAIILSMLVMLAFAGRVSGFIERHPTLKVLALSFLILIGVLLVAEGIGTHFNKGYIYFAMAFSLVVEMLNMKIRGPATTAVPASDD